MRSEFFIAVRYLTARRRGVFTLITTLVAVGGVTVGVAALIVTLAVMSGFHRDIQEKILGVQPHVTVSRIDQQPILAYDAIAARVRGVPGVRAVAPFVYGQIIIRGPMGMTGAVIKGVDLAAEHGLTGIRSTIVTLPAPDRLAPGDILLGTELARTLGAARGDGVILVSPGDGATAPRMRSFTVAGIYHSGMYEYDATLGLMSIPAAQRLFDMGSGITGIGIAASSPEHIERLELALQRELPLPLRARSWERMNKNLFAALKLEKIMMFIILTLIVIVAAFNIVSNLLLLTVEKAREVGILAALGFTRGQISRIFLAEGLLIGCIGTLAGTAIGTAIGWALKTYHFIRLPADVYYLDALPVRLAAGDIMAVVATALAVTLAASIFPARAAGRLDPVEAIRYG